jgi:hypothetical protein
MATAYYSTVLDRPAQDVWEIIRDFNNYPVWVAGAGESRIEDGKSGSTVGAIRNVLYQGHRIRQRLLAQSDVERSQTYEFCDAPTLPVTGFQATLRVTPVVDGNRAFVEWWANFDCEPLRIDEFSETLRIRFGRWLHSLRESMGPAALTELPAETRALGALAAIWGRFRHIVRNIRFFGRLDSRAQAVAFAVRIWHRSAGRRSRSGDNL